MDSPFILDETDDFAVVYKPPRMHCAPVGGNASLRRNAQSDTLVDWYAAIHPAIMGLSGRKEGEGGLLHRLDYETQGLVLFAKNQASLNFLLALQNEGKFIKEYSAICMKNHTWCIKNHTPPPPCDISSVRAGFVIESFFRPFGPGRKQVRPLVASDRGVCYRSEIIGIAKLGTDDRYACTVRLRRGFRHQIRCHLAWTGCPILNDPLYGDADGKQPTDGFLALRANGLFFTDPQSGEMREYRIEPLTSS